MTRSLMAPAFKVSPELLINTASGSCEDPRHPRGTPHGVVRRCIADGVVRCEACEQTFRRESRSAACETIRRLIAARAAAEADQDQPAFGSMHAPSMKRRIALTFSAGAGDEASRSQKRRRTVAPPMPSPMTPEKLTARRSIRLESVAFSGAMKQTHSIEMKAPPTTRSTRLPAECLDVYAHRSILRPLRPRRGGGLTILAAPTQAVKEDLRLSVENVLHGAFQGAGARATITQYSGLRPETIRSLRSGRRLSRATEIPKNYAGWWILWEMMNDEMVGAAVLARQQLSETETSSLGEATLEYIAVRSDKGGKGYPLVVAAEEICREQGLKELLSAADLSQPTALEAHRRWGFVDMDPEEWQRRNVHQYTKESRVHYMIKTIPPTEFPGAAVRGGA